MDFERLSHQHKDAVYRQMVRVCGNREDAEDVLIEALLKAYRSLGDLGAPEAFRAWLARIASRVCWQLKRREALQPLLQLSVLEEGGGELADGSPSAEAQAGAAEMKQLASSAKVAARKAGCGAGRQRATRPEIIVLWMQRGNEDGSKCETAGRCEV